MSVTTNYKELVKVLVESSHFTVTILDDPDKFKKKLTMAKYRARVEGKLDFDIKELSEEQTFEEFGVKAKSYLVGVALRPKLTKDVVQVLGKQEGL